MQDFIFDWKVNAYQIECLHNNKTDKDFLKVIIADKDFLKVIIADNVEGGEL